MDIKSELLSCLNGNIISNNQSILSNVSRETLDSKPCAFSSNYAKASVAEEFWCRIQKFVALLEEWNLKMNLVSKNSMSEVWTRHVLDSAQLFPLLPTNLQKLVDIGSGAGFPAMVLAVMLQAKHSPAEVIMVESITKKAAYLQDVSQKLGLTNVRVINDRVENIAFNNVDVITARAVAALDVLCGYICKAGSKHTHTLLLKGQGYATEEAEAQKYWQYQKKIYSNKYSDGGVIMDLWGIRKKK